MIKAILVDLDGTLVDTYEANKKAYITALESIAPSYNERELSQWIGKVAWPDMMAAVIPDKDQSVHSEVAEYKRQIYPRFFDLIEVNHQLVFCLQQFKAQCQIGLVTSASRGSVEPLLAEKNLAKLFDLVITSDDVTRQKPDPEPFSMAAKYFDVQPTECLVFEDSGVGLLAAEAFGSQVWQVHWSPTGS